MHSSNTDASQFLFLALDCLCAAAHALLRIQNHTALQPRVFTILASSQPSPSCSWQQPHAAAGKLEASCWMWYGKKLRHALVGKKKLHAAIAPDGLLVCSCAEFGFSSVACLTLLCNMHPAQCPRTAICSAAGPIQQNSIEADRGFCGALTYCFLQSWPRKSSPSPPCC